MQTQPIETRHIGTIAFQGTAAQIAADMRAMLGADHKSASADALRMIETKLAEEAK